MKVMITVKENAGLDSELDSRFGRAAYFLVYDTDEEKIVSMDENLFKNEDSGAGIKTGAFVIEKGCRAVIGPQTGPKLSEILREANVKQIAESKGTAKEALERYKDQLA
jgi:predicted Fe-Mo cluster-binding NifX family protein